MRIVYDPKEPILVRVGPILWDLREDTWRFDPFLFRIQREVLAPDPEGEAEIPPGDMAVLRLYSVPYPSRVVEGEAVWIRVFGRVLRPPAHEGVPDPG